MGNSHHECKFSLGSTGKERWPLGGFIFPLPLPFSLAFASSWRFWLPRQILLPLAPFRSFLSLEGGAGLAGVDGAALGDPSLLGAGTPLHFGFDERVSYGSLVRLFAAKFIQKLYSCAHNQANARLLLPGFESATLSIARDNNRRCLSLAYNL